MTLTTEWQDTYRIGVPEIDHQHQYFLLLIQRLEKMLHSDPPLAHLLDSVDELIKYAAFHFKSEENMMRFAHYPDLFNHTVSHLKLLEQLRLQSLKLAHLDPDPEDLIQFLVKWFLDHTTGEDLDFKLFLDSQTRPDH